MIVLRFGADALAHVRFGISPLLETIRSVRVLDDPAAQVLHLPWVIHARRLTDELELDVLRALQPADAYSPDFVHPPPTSPLAEFDDELERMASTPPEQIRSEIERTYAGRPLPPALEPFLDHPEEAIDGLAKLLGEYWRLTLAPHWRRIRALLQGDVLYRAREIADGGAERLFSDLHPTVRWDDGVLRVDKPAEGALDLDERGLLLVPSVFVWPVVSALMDPAWQPALVYPARGVGMLWEPSEVPLPEALAALLGRRRGAILLSLDQPRSTAELARRLEVSDSSVSQHLAVLSRAGLVSGHRVGRVVLYLRSATGDALVRPQRALSSA
jgi:DNA-binding transcriptional ArsR family regulator